MPPVSYRPRRKPRPLIMSSRPYSRSIPPEIRAAAAAWRCRRDAGLSASEEAEFSAWRDEELHAMASAEIDATWDALLRLDVQRPTVGTPDPDLLTRTNVVGLPIQTRFRLLRGALWSSVGIAAAAAFLFLAERRPLPPATAPTVTAEIAEVRRLDLPDGSVVHLNAGAAVDLLYGAAERRVRLLRGEARFVVVKDPSRPFRVAVGDLTVRAVGTAFNVRRDPTAVEVLVTEGTVRVEAMDESSLPPVATAGVQPVLVAGQRVVIPFGTGRSLPSLAVTSVPAAEIAHALAWSELRLEFADVTLAEAVARFNRHNQHRLVIADPELGQQRFGGTFRPEAYDAFVRLLEADFGVLAERSKDQTILRRASTASRGP